MASLNMEVHLLQNFAPNALNAGENGLPKSMPFGGVRREVLSSQSQKRAVRDWFRDVGGVARENHATRTRHLRGLLSSKLVRERGMDQDEADSISRNVILALGLGFGDANQTEYLLFLAEREIDRVVELCAEHAELLKVDEGWTGGKKGIVNNRIAVSGKADELLRNIFDGGLAFGPALFGRFVADQEIMSINAASQVAFAVATNRSTTNLDFFTAIDDLLVGQGSAGMMGHQGLMSSCMYRYANVDVQQLKENLQGDVELVKMALRLFVEGFSRSSPSGKINSTAAFNPPSWVMTVVRRDAPWNLSNAFSPAVSGEGRHGVVGNSVRALDTYWGKMARMFGDGGVDKIYLATTEDTQLFPNLSGFLQDSTAGVAEATVERALRLALPEGDDGA